MLNVEAAGGRWNDDVDVDTEGVVYGDSGGWE